MQLRSPEHLMFEVEVIHHIDGIMSMTADYSCFTFKWAKIAYISDIGISGMK